MDVEKSVPVCRRVKRCSFTLIELLVVTSQLCRDFFKRFICTDKYGCVRKHTENAALKNTPHHTYGSASNPSATAIFGDGHVELRSKWKIPGTWITTTNPAYYNQFYNPYPDKGQMGYYVMF